MLTTSRLTLQYPQGTDDPKVYPAVAAATAAILDKAAIYKSGTLVSRPAATAVAVGTFYYATDTSALAISNGTVWLTPGDLVAVASTSSVTAASGQWIIATPTSAMTLTLPAPTANNHLAITQQGSALLTITAGSSFILGIGGGSHSFTLGQGANTTIELRANGTFWYIVAGVPDTGWLPLTINTAVGYNDASGPPAVNGGPPAQARVIGSIGYLRDSIGNSSLTNNAAGTNVFTLPTGTAPFYAIQTTFTGSVLIAAGTGSATLGATGLFTFNLNGYMYSPYQN